jgi:hypothetical protein
VELGPVDPATTLDGLDDHAGRLSGVERLDPVARVQRLGVVLDVEAAFRPVDERGILARSCSIGLSELIDGNGWPLSIIVLFTGL